MPEKDMPASLQVALVSILVAVFGALATKYGIESKTSSDQIYVVASATAAIIGAGYNWLMLRLQTKKMEMQTEKVERAEKIVPGITSPNGPKTPKTVIFNDPSTPAPPVVISEPTEPEKGHEP